MNERDQLRLQRFDREKLVMRYADALEKGDLDTIGVILERAETDPELEQSLWEAQVALGEMLREDEDAAIVEGQEKSEERVLSLARSHFSASVTQSSTLPEEADTLTIGVMAATINRMMGLDPAIRERLRFLERNSEPAIIPRSERDVRTLMVRLGVNAPEQTLVRRVHEVLQSLGMHRQGPNVRLAAARRQKSNREGSNAATKSSNETSLLQNQNEDARTNRPTEEQP